MVFTVCALEMEINRLRLPEGYRMSNRHTFPEPLQQPENDFKKEKDNDKVH